MLGPAAFRGSYGSAPPGAYDAAGRSTARPAVQRPSRSRVAPAPSSLTWPLVLTPVTQAASQPLNERYAIPERDRQMT